MPVPDLMKLRQQFSALTFKFRIVFLCILHRQTLGDQSSRLIAPAHMGVHLSEFDVVHETVRIKFDRFLETCHGLSIGRLWKNFAIDRLRHRPLEGTDLGNLLMPTAYNVPTQIAVRTELER